MLERQLLKSLLVLGPLVDIVKKYLSNKMIRRFKGLLNIILSSLCFVPYDQTSCIQGLYFEIWGKGAVFVRNNKKNKTIKSISFRKKGNPTLVSCPLNELTRLFTKTFILSKSSDPTLPEPSKRNAMSAWVGHSAKKKKQSTSE